MSHNFFQMNGKEAQFSAEINRLFRSNAPNKNHKISKLVSEELNNSKDPYNTALLITVNSSDFFKGRHNGLAALVLDTFQQWLNSNPKDIVLTDDIKSSALNMACQQSNSNVLKKILTIFKMDASREQLKDQIEDMIDIKKYKEACVIATVYNMQQSFHIEAFAIPLILQDKVQLVEQYISVSTNSQQQLLSYLDKWIGDRLSIDHSLAKLDVPDVRHEKLVPKTLKKLVVRLMKMYDVDSKCCPNTLHERNKGALMYLLGKHAEPGGAQSNWGDMVPDAVGTDVELQKELIISLALSSDIAAAKKWQIHYELPLCDFPKSIQTMLTRTEEEFNDENWQSEDWNEELPKQKCEYYKLKLPVDKIKIVDNVDSFENCIQYLSQQKIVAMDNEWKPSFGMQVNKVALMQLATWEIVYLLDIITLLKCLETDDWLNLLHNVFCNNNVTVIGFGLQSDFNMIASTIPQIASQLKKTKNLLNCETLISTLNRKYRQLFPDGIITSNKTCTNLSSLIEMFFGQPLNKDEQFSDWEKRPLRQSQMVYAALDSYCLLEIYEYIIDLCEKNSIDFRDVTNGLLKTRQYR